MRSLRSCGFSTALYFRGASNEGDKEYDIEKKGTSSPLGFPPPPHIFMALLTNYQ